MPKKYELACLLFSTIAPFTTAHSQDVLGWKPGDSWEYQKLDFRTQRPLSLVHKQVVARSGENFSTLFEEDGIRIEELVSPGGTHTRPQARIAGIAGGYDYLPIQFPLKSDSEWTTTDRILSGRQIEFRRRVTCMTKGSEQVTVPAGTFATQVIQCKGNWLGPGGYSGAHEIVGWYAPDVRWFAKWRMRSTGAGGAFRDTDILQDYEYELTKFQLAND